MPYLQSSDRLEARLLGFWHLIDGDVNFGGDLNFGGDWLGPSSDAPSELGDGWWACDGDDDCCWGCDDGDHLEEDVVNGDDGDQLEEEEQEQVLPGLCIHKA